MKALEPLMEEHWLIERLVDMLESELQHIDMVNRVRPGLVAAATDFFKSYVLKTHLGKEEGILYRRLSGKELPGEHRIVRFELMEEHALSRKMVGSLASAVRRYSEGDSESAMDIASLFRGLVRLLPAHIEKESNRFFVLCTEYFTGQEQDEMLRQFREYDGRMIHERYRRVVDELAGARIFT